MTPVATPPAPPTPEQQRTMSLSTWEGSLTVVFGNWTSGMVLAGYLAYYGGAPWHFAMIGSIPLLAQMACPVAAWIHSMYPRPQRLTELFVLLGRGVWFIPVLFFLFSVDRANIPNALLGFLIFASVFGAMAGTIWTGWMGAVVPEHLRGRYFGTRNAIHAFVGMAAVLGAGWFLDHVPAPHGFIALFGLATVLALVACSMFRLHYEPKIPAAPLPFRETFTAPLRDKNFRKFLLFAVYWQASVQLASVFVYPFLQNHLKLTYTQIAIWFSLAAMTTLLAGPIWGRIADRYGNKFVLSVTTVIAGLLMPLSWILATPGDPTMIYVSGVLDGLGWSGVNPGMFNLLLETSQKKKSRVAFIGMLSLMTGISGFIGGALAAPLLGFLDQFPQDIGGKEWVGYHWLFLISMLLRMQAWQLLKPIHEDDAWRTRDVLRLSLSWGLGTFTGLMKRPKKGA